MCGEKLEVWRGKIKIFSIGLFTSEAPVRSQSAANLEKDERDYSGGWRLETAWLIRSDQITGPQSDHWSLLTEFGPELPPAVTG